MKKKWISAMLSLSLVASLAACGGKGEQIGRAHV